MKIRIVPVAAGPATAAGPAITGASPASAEATVTPSASATAYGQARKGRVGEGGAQASLHGNGDTDPTMSPRDDETYRPATERPGVDVARPRAPHRREW